jgi:hypothetical protein
VNHCGQCVCVVKKAGRVILQDDKKPSDGLCSCLRFSCPISNKSYALNQKRTLNPKRKAHLRV